jgi:hypothetical protein
MAAVAATLALAFAMNARRDVDVMDVPLVNAKDPVDVASSLPEVSPSRSSVQAL